MGRCSFSTGPSLVFSPLRLNMAVQGLSLAARMLRLSTFGIDTSWCQCKTRRPCVGMINPHDQPWMFIFSSCAQDAPTLRAEPIGMIKRGEHNTMPSFAWGLRRLHFHWTIAWSREPEIPDIRTASTLRVSEVRLSVVGLILQPLSPFHSS